MNKILQIELVGGGLKEFEFILESINNIQRSEKLRDSLPCLGW